MANTDQHRYTERIEACLLPEGPPPSPFEILTEYAVSRCEKCRIRLTADYMNIGDFILVDTRNHWAETPARTVLEGLHWLDQRSTQ